MNYFPLQVYHIYDSYTRTSGFVHWREFEARKRKSNVRVAVVFYLPKMTTKSVLQPLDVNSPSMDRSPARKRPRLESPVKERWSLVKKSGVELEDLHGVDLLEDTESDDQSDDEKITRTLITCSSSERLSPIEKENRCTPQCSRNVSIKDWNEFLFRKPDIMEHPIKNYFDQISDEVILHVFHFLPKRILSPVALVCKRWHRLSQDESLWARMDLASRQLQPGAMGHILSRQVLILRLSQAEIAHPPILEGSYPFSEDFRGRLLFLDLSMAHVAPESLVEIFRRCERLKKVSLEHVRVTSDVMTALACSRDLEILNLAMAEGINEKGLRSLIGNCLKLREVNLAWTGLNSASLQYVCSNLPVVLDRVNLSGCRKVLTDDYIRKLVIRCPKLRELDLSDCTGLTGEVIQHITTLECLNFLALSRCYLVPYKSLIHLKQVKTLMYLDVHGGYIDTAELRYIQETLGSSVHLNKFKFSSIARPTVGTRRSSIWNMRVRD